MARFDIGNTDGWYYWNAEYGDFAQTDIYCKPFIDLWHSKCEEGHLPARSDFHFEDFKNHLGYISIDEVTYSPFCMKNKLHGVHLRDIDGSDMTHQSLVFVGGDEDVHNKLYMKQHELASETHSITRSIGPNLVNHINYTVQWLGLPCADNGQKVTHFISIASIMMNSEFDQVVI